MLPDNTLKELIEQCNNVYLFVSMDGLYETNDWYRWPSKFDHCMNVRKTFEQWWKDNSKIHFATHTVVNLINVIELEKFLDFMSNELPLWRGGWDWIRWPHWQQLSVLPESVKDSLITKFDKLNKNYNYSNIDNPYEVTIERLKEPRAVSWDTVKENILRISKERNLSFSTMVPSFKEIWNINE